MDINLLQKLISINSVNSEKEINDYIYNHIHSKYGDRLNYTKDTIREDGSYNLIVSNTPNPELILAGHVDTVPHNSIEQLSPIIKNQRLYGRGVVDMKGGVFMNIELIDFLLENNIGFRNLFYCDEETNFLGMNDFVKKYSGKIKPKLTIVPEPTNCQIIKGFRGIASLEISLRGKCAHSSRKELGINPIEKALDYIKEVELFIKRQDNFGLNSSVNLAGISGGIMQDGILTEKDNIVPDYCRMMFSLRMGNTIKEEDFKNFTRDYFHERNIIVEKYNCAFWIKPMIQDGIKEKYSQIYQVNAGANFGYSDIQMIFEQIGGECLLIGPGPFEKAHSEDEYLELETLEQSYEIIKKVILVNKI